MIVKNTNIFDLIILKNLFIKNVINKNICLKINYI